MTYKKQQVADLRKQAGSVAQDLQSLNFEGLRQSQSIVAKDARNHITHGAGRRLEILKSALETIFRVFPPGRRAPLAREKRLQAQIALHAFAINVLGIFDNWAWAFVLRHRLRVAVGDHRNIGLFKVATQKLLPTPLRDYLISEAISNWYGTYAKGYRDALAHRIPLYIPPASWTQDDAKLYTQLESEKVECIRTRQWARLDEVWARQDRIGKACPVFLHAFSDSPNDRPLMLHPQLLCDGATVVEIGRRFYSSWDRHPN
jgi:hypothetical protein